MALKVTGKYDDSLARLSTGDVAHAAVTWGFDDACTVIVGANGSPGEDLVEGEEGAAEMNFLLAQLVNTTGLESGPFFLDVDKTALVEGNHFLSWEYDYVADGDDDPFQGVGIRILFHKFSSEFDPVKVKWDGVDEFQFTGPIVVAAFNMDGRSGKRGRRAISCGGDLDNKVTVTVFPSS